MSVDWPLHKLQGSLLRINFRSCCSFLRFALGINNCTLCLMIAEASNFRFHNKCLIHFLPRTASPVEQSGIVTQN